MSKMSSTAKTTIILWSMACVAVFVIALVRMHSLEQRCSSLEERNEFKYELIRCQDSIIIYQDNLINKIYDHLWEKHGCDNPVLDGDLPVRLQQLNEKLDSIYKTQI